MAPNFLAHGALLVWPLFAVAFYAARRGTESLARTTAWMVLLPVMFLPSGFAIDLRGVPDLDKNRAAFLAVAVALKLFHPDPRRDGLRAHRFARIVLCALVFGAFQTARTNGDALVFGPTVLPGLTTWDALSLAAEAFLDFYLPFAIGERVFRTDRDVRDLLEVLATCGLVYAPLAFVEVLLSPQLHRWIYGYYQHAFYQHIRAGGYRPMLFMRHGLSVALFAFMSLQASLALARVRARTRIEPGVLVVASAAMLVMCKSMASGVYAVAASALQLLFSEKARARLVAVLAVVVLAYPVLRMEHVFPTKPLVDLFAGISPERAGSLAFRFDQEERLLARAQQRPLYGWGPWARSHIFAPWGQRISISDGAWVIRLGEAGYVGFVGFFLLLVAPLLRFARNRPRMPQRSQILIGSLALILAVCAVDLLPNGRLDFLPTLWAGALFALSDARRFVASARGDQASGSFPGSRAVRTHSRGGLAAPVAARYTFQAM